MDQEQVQGGGCQAVQYHDSGTSHGSHGRYHQGCHVLRHDSGWILASGSCRDSRLKDSRLSGRVSGASMGLVVKYKVSSLMRLTSQWASRLGTSVGGRGFTKCFQVHAARPEHRASQVRTQVLVSQARCCKLFMDCDQEASRNLGK